MMGSACRQEDTAREQGWQGWSVMTDGIELALKRPRTDAGIQELVGNDEIVWGGGGGTCAEKASGVTRFTNPFWLNKIKDGLSSIMSPSSGAIGAFSIICNKTAQLSAIITINPAITHTAVNQEPDPLNFHTRMACSLALTQLCDQQ